MLFNKQEIFDKIWKHAVVEQNLPSYSWFGDSNTICKYRDGEGHKCFVGVLIPDSVYKPEFEAKTLTNVAKQIFDSEMITNDNIDFLAELQKIHDYAAGRLSSSSHTIDDYFVEVKTKLERFAKQHLLSVTEL